MSDALNEPQAESVVPPPGIDAPVQPEPAAEVMPVAAAFPISARGRVWPRRRRPCHPDRASTGRAPVSPSTLPPFRIRRCRRARRDVGSRCP